MIRRLVRSFGSWATTRPDRSVPLLLAAMALLPMLWTRPGRVSADTKTYLTIDPGQVLSQARWMWDPTVGAGTVPHQNIGYLFPLGPYYWLLDTIGSPDWIAQRLLWAAMVFAAAYGTYRLARSWSWAPAPALVAAVAYGFTPYVFSYLARLSVILGPWAAMPWMVLFASQAVRTRSWRPAAWFAVTVALVGSVNATSLVLAGLAPLVWIAVDVVARRVRPSAAIGGALRIGVLCAGVSAWWIAGLQLQGRYGIPILRYTETYQSVASASTAPEVLRGLGYWYFYGGDRLDLWVDNSHWYVDSVPMMVLGFGLAGLSMLGLLCRFAGRAFAVALLLVGLAVSVGAAPLGASTPYGSAFEWFTEASTAGAALRSTTRAAPLVILALALGLGAAVTAVQEFLERRRGAVRSTRRWVPAIAVVLVALQMGPWFAGGALSDALLRDEDLPDHMVELGDWLDANGDGRVYTIPGADFAQYRWGGTVDPVLPGLTDRSVLYRELIPQGGDGTADLLNAFERRLAEGWFEPPTLGPIAELLGVETLVVRNDLEHERFRLARPGAVWFDVASVLGTPDHAGPSTADQPVIPMIDELALARPVADRFPVVAAFDLDAAPLLLAQPADALVVLAGSGDGVVDLAATGLLDADRPLLYAATLDDLVEAGADPASLLGAAGERWWVVTDTNRRQGRHWSTIGANLGALEAEGPLELDDDPGDNRLEPFDDTLAEQTVAAHRGDVAATRSSYYGNRIAYTPEDAPWYAIDGDPTTAWRAGAFDETIGLVWEADFVEPVDADSMQLLQPITGVVDRYITELRVTLDDDVTFDVRLDESSRSEPGQTIPLPDRAFRTLRLQVVMDNLGRISNYAARPGVGIAEIRLDGLVDDRVVRLPSVVGPATEAAGVAPDATDRLTYLFTRQRIDPATPNRTAPERRLVREFEVPAERALVVGGEARLAADATDDVLAGIVTDGPTARSDRRLPGSPGSYGPASVDGDLTTAWRTPFDEALGSRLAVDVPSDGAVEGVRFTWLDDADHSVPTEVVLDDGTSSWTLTLATDPGDDGLATSTHDLPGFDGSIATVTVTAIAPRTSPEYFSRLPQELPVAFAEVELLGAVTPPPPNDVDTGCRDDLLFLDGRPVPVRIAGGLDAALGRGPLALTGCGEPLVLEPGVHRLEAVLGSRTGLDLDRIVLDGPGIDGPVIDSADSIAPATTIPIVSSAPDEIVATIPATDGLTWLTMRQSWNAGWTATVDGVDLGPPTLIDGYANGWVLPAGGDERSLLLRWTPQGGITIGLAISALTAVACVAILLATRRRTAGDPAVPPDDVAPGAGPPQGDVRLLAAATAGVLFVVGGPLAAVVAGLVVVVSASWRRAVAVGAIAVTWSVVSIGIVGIEWRRDYPSGPDWPSRFGWAGPLTWTAIAVVVGALVADTIVARRAERPRSAAPAEDQ